jgi:hypothetical protein
MLDPPRSNVKPTLHRRPVSDALREMRGDVKILRDLPADPRRRLYAAQTFEPTASGKLTTQVFGQMREHGDRIDQVKAGWRQCE